MRGYDKEQKQWVNINSASNTPISDLSDSFESDNVEGALQEVAAKNIEFLSRMNAYNTTIEGVQEEIAWLNNKKAYVFQSNEPSNKNALWIKEDGTEELSGDQYNVDDLISTIKAYKSTMDSLVTIVTALQKDVEYIKTHGTVVKPEDTNIENALVTEDGTYLVTEDGVYLVTQGASVTPEPTPKGEKLTTSDGKYLVTDKQQFIKISR